MTTMHEDSKFRDTHHGNEVGIPELSIRTSADPCDEVWQRGVALESHVFVDVRKYNPDQEELHAYYGPYEDHTIMLSAEATTTTGEVVSISNIRLILPILDNVNQSDSSPTLRTLDDVMNGKLLLYGNAELEMLKAAYNAGVLAEGGTISKPPSTELITMFNIGANEARRLKENLNVELFSEVLKLCHERKISFLLAATDTGYYAMLNQMFEGKDIIKALGPECILGEDPVVVAVYNVEASIENFGIQL